jgi:hypothetical protein
MNEALLIFVRPPELGKVKTRLAAQIGAQKALDVYIRLLQHTKKTVSALSCHQFVFTTGKQHDDFWKSFNLQQQTGKDLGERMQNAFQSLFEKGYGKVLIIGSDCPSLTAAIIQKGFEALDENDMVIGPAEDGGYYLLGMKRMHTRIFHNKQWSTNTVYADTLKDIEVLALRYSTLPMLNDVDELKDVPEGWLL